MKATLAGKLTRILESWDELTKEELRKRITLIRDELQGGDGHAQLVESVTSAAEEALLRKMPELETDDYIEWEERGTGESFRSLCALLKSNAIPTETLKLGCKGEKKVHCLFNVKYDVFVG